MSPIFSFEDSAGAIRPQIWPHVVPLKGLELQIVFTGVAAVKAALAAAAAFAHELDARFTILATLVVPYPLPLEDTPAQSRLLEQTLGAIADEQPVETAVQVYICRDACDTMRSVLQNESTVLIGGRKRWWWPTREQRLASLLRRDGHRVMFLNVNAA